MSQTEENTCAACEGEIKGAVNVVFYNGHPLPLCYSCMKLGSDDQLNPEEVKELLKQRANPTFKGKAKETVKRYLNARNTKLH